MLLAPPVAGLATARHRARWPEPDPGVRAADLAELLRRVRIRGRGGAGFPLADKVAATGGRTRAVVVNVAESEPGSAKDAVLMLTAPHLVLDGAVLVATALGAPRVQVVVPGHRAAVADAARRAVAARDGDRMRWEVAATTGGFVGGQAAAVQELLAGRANRPVTRWVPGAAAGRASVLLSNAETFAHVAAAWALGPGRYAGLGTPEEPGTTLLTVGGDGRVDDGGATVAEVEHGRRLVEVVPELALPVGGREPAALLGGYHGTWVSGDALSRVRIGRVTARRVRPVLGAGVVLPLRADACPVAATAAVLGFLSAERARQCGPCDAGLPELAGTAATLARPGLGAPATVEHLVMLARAVDGRGACSHPDAAARLALSLLEAFPDEVEAHRAGGCAVRERPAPPASRLGRRAR
jgi:NADH:ubiquinone oxidoreductase subunit F (NADH-binding)